MPQGVSTGAGRAADVIAGDGERFDRIADLSLGLPIATLIKLRRASSPKTPGVAG